MPLGKNPQEMRLLVVLHRGDRILASSSPGWDGGGAVMG